MMNASGPGIPNTTAEARGPNAKTGILVIVIFMVLSASVPHRTFLKCQI